MIATNANGYRLDVLNGDVIVACDERHYLRAAPLELCAQLPAARLLLVEARAPRAPAACGRAQ